MISLGKSDHFTVAIKVIGGIEEDQREKYNRNRMNYTRANFLEPKRF